MLTDEELFARYIHRETLRKAEEEAAAEAARPKPIVVPVEVIDAPRPAHPELAEPARTLH